MGNEAFQNAGKRVVVAFELEIRLFMQAVRIDNDNKLVVYRNREASLL